MRIATTRSAVDSVEQAVSDCLADLSAQLEAPPDVVFVAASARRSIAGLAAALHARAPGVRVHGGTSCMGAMTDGGHHGGASVAMLGIRDPDGAYGVGCSAIGSDPRAAGRRAIEAALANAERAGEVPSAVWLTAVPGHEESVLRGIEDVVGASVPIFGGSAADDDVSGGWSVFTQGAAHRDAVLATALFPSTRIAFNFHSGYEPTERHGRVTRAEGRVLCEIDGRPAAHVYDEWTGGSITDLLDGQAHGVLARTTLHPLGRAVGAAGAVAIFQLSHPERVEPGGGLGLFTDIAVDDEIVLMRGTHRSLVDRARRVASGALAHEGLAPSDVAGALVIYCAGCMLAVQGEMDTIVAGLRGALGGAPFLGAFTFGEQGCLAGQNQHGNLMIATLAFAR